MPIRYWQSALDPAGRQAALIAEHSWFLIVVTTIVGAAVLAALAYGLLRGMATARAHSEVDTAPSDRRPAAAVGAALAGTVVILFAILVDSMRTGRLVAAFAAPDALAITVTGHQFWWDVRYDPGSPAARATTANEIHVPVGRPVRIVLRSSDVIHSFWVPMLHGKRDLIPGTETAIHLRADRAGVFQGQCAEFCGRQHAHMALTVTAEPEPAFAAWLARQRQPAAPAAGARERRGEQLFLLRGCAACHTITGTEARGTVGPDLTHVGSRPTLGAGTLANTADDMARWIRDPQQMKPGNQMPPTRLADDDVRALAAYLRGLS